MVIVQLMGGLGNQLFQYAAARRLSYAEDAPLKLDVSGFASDSKRSYNLHPFNIVQEFASLEDVARLKGTGLVSLLRLGQKFRSYHQRTWLVERHFHFDPAILQASGDVYLDGYWQSERYFKDIESIIRKEFSLKSPLAPVNRVLAEKIQDIESVSLHVRRGDYVSRADVRLVHPTCPLDYYRCALRRLLDAGVRPHLFVFSDDPNWVEAHLKKELDLEWPTTIVNHNGVEKAHEDLRLMSLCQHHIIANSSFSWWGAWLSNNPGKIVIAPKMWCHPSAYDTRDLIPTGWQRI